MSKCGPMSPELRRLLDREYGDLFPDADSTEAMIPPSQDGEGDDDAEPNVMANPTDTVQNTRQTEAPSYARGIGSEFSRLLASYSDHLARANSEAVSFIPRPRLEQYAEKGQILAATENDELCGVLVYGSGWPVLRIYQAIIQYDARRLDHGLDLVARLEAVARERGCSAIALKCAEELDANSFWRAAGFEQVRQIPGGKRRGRILNQWVRDVHSLFQVNATNDGRRKETL